MQADKNSPNIIFGYRLPGSQVRIDREKAGPLRGLDVVEGYSGVRAIHPILDGWSSWIGQPDTDDSESFCEHTSLIAEEGIKALSCEFDVSSSIKWN